MERWLVVVTGPGMINDIRRASDEQMSFDDAIAEVSNYRNMFSNHSEEFS